MLQKHFHSTATISSLVNRQRNKIGTKRLSRSIYSIPLKEPTFIEKYGRPLSMFIIYSSLGYLSLSYFQLKWEAEELNKIHEKRLSDLENRKNELQSELEAKLKHNDQLQESIPAESSKQKSRWGWFWSWRYTLIFMFKMWFYHLSILLKE